jgi:hypothetical protein
MRADTGNDLYKPSLDSSHDADQFESSWNPLSLLLPVFFGGAFTALVLYPMNAKFMGRSSDWRWLVPLFGAIGLGAVAARVVLEVAITEGEVTDVDDAFQYLRFGTRAVTLLAAFFVGRRQEATHRLALGTDRPLLLPGFLALCVGLVISTTLSTLASSLFVGVPA